MKRPISLKEEDKMDTFLIISWPLLIVISYQAAIYTLKKVGKL